MSDMFSRESLARDLPASVVVFFVALPLCLGIALASSQVHTIGGLVIQQLGRLPRRGETVTLDDVRFTILKTDRRRVYTLRAQFPDSAADG